MLALRPYPRLVFVMAVLATMTPIFAGYLVGFLLLLWLWSASRVEGSAGANKLAAAETANRFRSLVLPIDLGVAALVVTQVVAGVLVAFGSRSFELASVFKTTGHMLVKWGLLWLVISRAVCQGARRGLRPHHFAVTFAYAMGIVLVYGLAQRQWGLDWVHGLSARLPSSRYAYGVYRISGFMGHPLTLAYNAALVVLAALSLSLRRSARHKNAWTWALVVACGALLLICSGSRFVLVVLALTLGICEGWRWRRHWWVVLGGGIVVAGGLWIEGSTVGRWQELFDQGVPLEARFTRLVFWRTHLQIFLDHPWVGTGLAHIDRVADTYYDAAGIFDHSLRFTAHNLFLQVAADTGLLGLAGLAAWFVGFFAAARLAILISGRRSRGLLWLGVATLLVACVQNCLRDSEYTFALWFLASLVALDAVSVETKDHSEPSGGV